ncbi:MAG: hypothetical protein AMJ62_14190 [Myxococcales bacterium SG8_38]|nr:MAG: hypothetical protein AMJ62_14190 [Myxococcales bacterium SG8_38]
MTYARVRLAAMAAWLLVAFIGCDGGAVDDGGTGGSSGSDGANGALVAQSPGLWEGDSPGVEVCFFVSEDRRRLTASSQCDVFDAGGDGQAYDLRVDMVGTDETGQPCGFELSFGADVPIDPATGVFRVSGIEAPDGQTQLSFSGQIRGAWASGAAQSERNGSSCRVGWAATKSSECDDAAIDVCFALQQCCRSILVNPVFFQSCNAVVLQCNRAACQDLLDGYPRCRERESEVEPNETSALAQ